MHAKARGYYAPRWKWSHLITHLLQRGHSGRAASRAPHARYWSLQQQRSQSRLALWGLGLPFTGGRFQYADVGFRFWSSSTHLAMKTPSPPRLPWGGGDSFDNARWSLAEIRIYCFHLKFRYLLCSATIRNKVQLLSFKKINTNQLITDNKLIIKAHFQLDEPSILSVQLRLRAAAQLPSAPTGITLKTRDTPPQQDVSFPSLSLFLCLACGTQMRCESL